MQLTTFIQNVKEQTPIAENPFFHSLDNDTLSKESFICSQQHFYYAVLHFSRPMLALTARLPSYEQRWTILKNIIEEHGNGDLNKTHGDSFLRFLESFAAAPVFAPHFCIESFNLSLDEICGHRDWRLAVAVLGIIEERFAEISLFIAQRIVDNGWLSASNLEHYHLHQDLDLNHAADFYSLLQEEWLYHPEIIQQGLQLGNELFLQLYEQLWMISTQ